MYDHSHSRSTYIHSYCHVAYLKERTTSREKSINYAVIDINSTSWNENEKIFLHLGIEDGIVVR